MDNIPDLQSQYNEQPKGRIAALRLITPHPGVWLTVKDDKPEPAPTKPAGQRAQEMSAFPTRGIDVMLILLRQLISFKFEIDTPIDITTQEQAFVEAASVDLGWRRKGDWRLKRHLFDQLDCRNQECMQKKEWEFEDQLSHKQLSNLFYDNQQFRIVSTRAYAKPILPPDGFKEHVFGYLSPTMNSRKCLQCNSVTPLPEYISNLFDSVGSTTQFVSCAPTFLQIKYTISTKIVPLESLLVLQFEAPMIKRHNSEYLVGIQKPEYKLCAIVRLAGGETADGIRTYRKDGGKIVRERDSSFWPTAPS